MNYYINSGIKSHFDCVIDTTVISEYDLSKIVDGIRTKTVAQRVSTTGSRYARVTVSSYDITTAQRAYEYFQASPMPIIYMSPLNKDRER